MYDTVLVDLENLFYVQNFLRREERIKSKIKKELKCWTSAVLDKKLTAYIKQL